MHQPDSQLTCSFLVRDQKRKRTEDDNATRNKTRRRKRKSTAQPRPVLNIPPRGIGPILEPTMNDVLCGRGGRINSHFGNMQFRDLVLENRNKYLAESTKKLAKAYIAAELVAKIRSMDPPGRFLKQDSTNGLWYDIGDAKAIKKAGQAFREDAPGMRPKVDKESLQRLREVSSSSKQGDEIISENPSTLATADVLSMTKESATIIAPVPPKSSSPVSLQSASSPSDVGFQSHHDHGSTQTPIYAPFNHRQRLSTLRQQRLQTLSTQLNSSARQFPSPTILYNMTTAQKPQECLPQTSSANVIQALRRTQGQGLSYMDNAFGRSFLLPQGSTALVTDMTSLLPSFSARTDTSHVSDLEYDRFYRLASSCLGHIEQV